MDLAFQREHLAAASGVRPGDARAPAQSPEVEVSKRYQSPLQGRFLLSRPKIYRHSVRMVHWAAERLRHAWKRAPLWSWLVLGGVMVFVMVVRFRLRSMPLERDEGEFAYGGQLLLQGLLPGQLLYTMKLPGTHASYAVLMALFGQTCAGVHLGFLIVNCATIALVYWFACAAGGTLAGPIAAAVYAVFSLSSEVLGTAAHASHFVVLLALPGLLLLWKATKSGRLIVYLCSGLLLSGSVLMKHNGLLFVAFGSAWLLLLGCARKLGPNQSFLKALGAFFLGLAAPLSLLLLVLWQAHTLETCWFWSVIYARTYSGPNPGATLAWRMMGQRMPSVLHQPFYFALCGLPILWRKRDFWSTAIFLTGFLATSVLAVIPGFHFRPHYFVLMLPALAVVVGALVQQATEFLLSRFRFLVPVPILLVACFLASAVWRERALLFQLTPSQACRSLYGSDLFPQALILGEYLRTNSAPDARIAVLGSEPEIYFYSHRRSATGFVYTYPLTEHHPFSQKMQQQMSEEIQATEPQFIVLVQDWTSWQSRPGSPQRLAALWAALTPPHYRLIGSSGFSESQSVWRWPPQALQLSPNQSSQLLVFQRNLQRPSP